MSERKCIGKRKRERMSTEEEEQHVKKKNVKNSTKNVKYFKMFRQCVRYFGGKRSWVDRNKNQNLYLDLGHLIGSLRRKKKLRAWSEDSKRLDVVVFENKEEERYDHDDYLRGI